MTITTTDRNFIETIRYYEALQSSTNSFDYSDLGGRVQVSTNVKRDPLNLSLLDIKEDLLKIAYCIAAGTLDGHRYMLSGFLPGATVDVALIALRSRTMQLEEIHALAERKKKPTRESIGAIVMDFRGDIADPYIRMILAHYNRLLDSHEANRAQGAKRDTLMNIAGLGSKEAVISE